LPEIDLIDDKAGKPVGIQQVIGRRPIAAFGNSDGDFEMLEWTTAGGGPRLGMIVHHTDAEREWAYDRESPVGKLARGLDEAQRRGWIIVDMKRDWRTIYRADRPAAAASMTNNWKLVSLEGAPVPADGSAPTMSVDADGRISGFAGVNRYFANRSANPGVLFGAVGMTRMAGPPEAMQLEGRFVAALAKVDRFDRTENDLRLFAGDQVLMHFEAVR
jgi:heat shock protein HslJ